MPRLEPALRPVVTDLERGLRTLGVPFAVVGALVPELLLDVRPTRMTNDADVTVTAFSDRKASKDLAGVFHCLRYYREDDERRYGVEHDGAGVPFEYTGAYLLGIDGRPFLSTQVSQAVWPVLDRVADLDSDGVAIVARERGRIVVEEDERLDVFEHFQWYRRGIGL